jgi:hypothetical protein
VLEPQGEPATKIVPQAPDSTRPGTNESVWLVGSTGNIVVDDSTAPRTLSIRLESSLTSALATFTMEATQITSGGWVLLATDFPALDGTKLIQESPSSAEFYRINAGLRFEPGVSDAQKQAFFATHELSVLGVTSSGLFFVQFADPGISYTAFRAFLNSLESQSEVSRIVPLVRSALPPLDAGDR